jgi:hypothetical protein
MFAAACFDVTAQAQVADPAPPDPAAPAAAPSAPAHPPSAIPNPPSPVPSFPATLSGEIRARYYYVHNLYDRNNKNNDDLNLGTEMVRLRGEGKPLEELTLRVGVFQVRSVGLGSRKVVDAPRVTDEQEREFEVDRAHLEWKPADEPAWTFTAGRQDIVLGNGFLVGDGVRLQELHNLIGYIENNRQDFDALRADWKTEGWAVTAFASRVPDSEGVRSLRDLFLYGLDVEHDPGPVGHRPGLSLVFARDERGREDLLGPIRTVPLGPAAFPWTLDDQNGRTFAAALRSKGPIVRPFGYSVEVARQIGSSPSGANDNPLSRDAVALRAWGTDARLLMFLHPERKDFIRLRHVFLSGDEPGGANTQFDPILENQILGILFNAQNNIRAWDLGASVTSWEGWQFHADFWHFRFDEAYTRVLPFGLSRSSRLDAGNELDLVVSRQWSPHWKTELLAAALQVGDGWTRENNNPVGFFTSNDLVWGVRLTATFSF